MTGEVVHDPHPSRDGVTGDFLDAMILTDPYPMGVS